MKEHGAWLVVIQAPPDTKLLGARFELRRELRIGRDPSCDISLDTPSLFPHHASVKRFGSSQLEIEVGHANAEVLVDDRSTKFSVLQPGATLAVGPLWFRILAGESAEALYHEEIYRMTITDSLTGVNNLRYLEEALEREILRARRYSRPLALCCLELVGLDALDRVSPVEGDRCLRTVGKQLSALSPNTFIVARVRGREFAIVMPEVDLEIARARCSQLVEQIASAVPDITLSWAITRLEPTDPDGRALFARVRSS